MRKEPRDPAKKSVAQAEATLTTQVTVDFKDHVDVLAAIDREAADNDRSRGAQIRIACRFWASQRGAL